MPHWSRDIEEGESVLVPGSNETALGIDSQALLMEPAFPIYQIAGAEVLHPVLLSPAFPLR